jgi:DNA-binding HxlR family transcriptional regulator
MADEPEEVSYTRALAGAIALVRPKWAIAVLTGLARGPLRLGDLLAEINEHHRVAYEPELSNKVLTETLKPLVEAGLVENAKEADTFAAASWYGLTHTGQAFIRASRPLVKWYHHHR